MSAGDLMKYNTKLERGSACVLVRVCSGDWCSVQMNDLVSVLSGGVTQNSVLVGLFSEGVWGEESE